MRGQDSTITVETPTNIKATTGAAWVTQQTLIAGETNPASATNSYLKTFTPGKTVILAGTSAVTIGTSTAANDTLLLQVTILKNAGPATATLTGFADNTGAAQTILLSGSTSQDTVYSWPCGLVNGKAALQVTPSVTLTTVVSYNPV